MDKQTPARIGRYQIVERVGQGVTGAVYKAFDPMIKRNLSIKTVSVGAGPDTDEYRSFLEKFYQEARTAGSLTHSNIMTVFDVGEDGGVPYLALEFIDGDLLSKLFSRGATFRPQGALAIVAQVAGALDFAHSKGVLHRNLNPGTVILYHRNRVKVMDFGMTTFGSAEFASGSISQEWRGAFAAPEVLADGRVDHRADIYSLAVLAHTVLLGEPPRLDSATGYIPADPLMAKSMDDSGFIPGHLQALLMTALARDPAERYGAASELTQALFDARKDRTLSRESFLQKELESGPQAVVSLKEPRPAEAAPSPPPLPSQPVETVQLPRVPPPPPARSESADAEAEEAEPTAILSMRGTMVLPPAQPALPQEQPATRPMPVVAPPILQTPAPAVPPVPPAQHPAPPPPTSAAHAGPAAPAAAPVAARAPARGKSGAGSRSVFMIVVVLLLAGLVGGGYYLMTGPTPQPLPPTDESPVDQPSEQTPPQTQPVVEQPPPAAATGSLEVSSTPPGATVTINGEVAGTTPVTRSGLAAGMYAIRIELKGYAPVEEMRELLADMTAPVQVQVALKQEQAAETTGALRVTSTPPGAKITLNGKPAGVTPTVLSKLRPGKHVLELSLSGHINWVGQPSVKAGKTADVSATMQAIRISQPEPPKPPPVVVERGPVPLTPDIKFDRKPVSGDQPVVPRAAGKISGSVLVKITVSESGAVQDVDIQESGGMVLDRVVNDTVRRWKFKPPARNGKPVSVYFLYRFTFRSEK